MGLFDQFPYTNFHELNLDWILQALKELEHTIDQFVAINALKYADPIQWDITSQYEKNTIVIDPQTGTAFISVQPVPIGVSLTNPDYWTVVFDLGSFVVRAAKNLANTYEAETTLTATVNTPAGGWLVWGDTLYKANVNITAGDSYVEGGNISQFTIEDVVGHLKDLNTTDKSNLVAAINALALEVLNKIGDLADLDTTDKSNLVAAINEVFTKISTDIGAEALARESADGDLADLATTDKSNLVAAINEVSADIGAEALARETADGDLADLDTTDKSNLVAAINEVLVTNTMWIDVTNHGVVNDGVTDCTQALQTLINNTTSGVLYFPEGTYLISSITLPARKISILGDSNFNSVFKCASDNVSLIIDHDTFSDNTRSIEYITINGNNKTGVKCFDFYRVRYRYIANIHFINCYDGFYVDCSRNMTIKNIYQVGDLHNEFTSSRKADSEYNWNTVVDGWLVDTNYNPTPHGAWFTLNAMICTQWSNLVTEGRLECIGFDIKGMNEGTFFNNVVLVCPTFGIQIAAEDGVQPACVDINNFSIDQPLSGGIIANCWWLMVNNFSCVNGNQRNNTEAAIIIVAGSKDIFFSNVIIYNMNYAAFNIGDAQRVFLSNCSAKDGTISPYSYICATQTATNPKVINCDFGTVSANGLTFKPAFNQFS